MRQAISSTPKGRNPDWSRDETILLMDLYLSAPRASKSHPEVVALSAILRAAGTCDGRAVLATFRNPAGIAMRLRNFAKQDPEARGSDAGLRAGGPVDALVWREFESDRSALAAEVSRIRRAISAEQWTPTVRSTHGPSPSYGPRGAVVSDGRTGVYVLLIDGPTELLAPGRSPAAGWAVVKLGRTTDIERRMGELACGLPPRSTLRYLPIGFRLFASGMAAHAFERALLDECDRSGWSLGGEFAFAPLVQIKRLLAQRLAPAPRRTRQAVVEAEPAPTV